ncbi:hypothetical protein GG344DRAFT_84788 [Lentinula edodes]|nr:hypothetical protein GG344DRAFT_84788 [Lentinula edodes]
MPRDDSNVPQYKKIEQMAKDLEWYHAESYFASREDAKDDKVMDQQMIPNVNLATWEFGSVKGGVTKQSGEAEQLSKAEQLVLGAGWSSKGATGTATEDRNDLVVAGAKRW